MDPFSKEHRRHIVLIAFLAWIGLGADGLSSSCYGPALGYSALGSHHHLALYLAVLTSATVFLIALSYNQVIELFPNGGGGYKVARVLLGPMAGVISGVALLVDYMLTISISIASGVEAIYSLLPLKYGRHKVLTEVIVILILMLLNIRGMKESIKILMPIFLGFLISHLLIIGYGIFIQGNQLPVIFTSTVHETRHSMDTIGFIGVMVILLRAYSLGSSTYTGLEAVSNNVNILAEPRVRTGRATMLYMAFSLSIVAGGIILLFLLWHVREIPGMTLNAAVFQQILGISHFGVAALIILLFFEAGLLVVGANTGFLGGPAVLANMAQDDWVPRRFSALSSRLVKQNGVLLFGILSAILIIVTDGSIEVLVIFYSINVFITFSISLLGLSVYWWKNKSTEKNWIGRLALSFSAFLICAFILLITIITKVSEGSLVALFATILIAILCYVFQSYYKKYDKLKRKLDKELRVPLTQLTTAHVSKLDPKEPTAVFLVKNIGSTLHTVLWVERMFPKHFKNYVFLSYGLVDTGSFGSDVALRRLKNQTDRVLDYLVNFATQHGINAEAISDYGADPSEDIIAMAEKINLKYHNSVYFASQYVFLQETLLTRFLHSDFVYSMQRRLQRMGTKILVVPINLPGKVK